ncbi:MAG: PilN domain-containing protein [Sodalis sp. (in: enterobacteria)]|uniref:PilN domain-containing protein n=1 Tax=Sodalis sp. (in: enterobacteria) TaxID=1898979 RepID=UPI0039E28B6A
MPEGTARHADTPAAYWRHQRLTLEICLAETHPLPEAPQAGPIARAAAQSASTAQRQLAISNQRYVHLFRQLPALLSPQLWLTEIEQRGDRLYISGCSEGYPPVVTLRRRLTDHATLPNFRWREVRRRDSSRWQFSLVAAWPSEEGA